MEKVSSCELAGLEAHLHNAQHAQHGQQAAGQGEEEELAGRQLPLRAAPDADQEIERHQRQLEEHVEQDDVERQENAHHNGLQGQQPGVELVGPVMDAPPRDQHGRQHQRGGQHHHPDVETIDAEEELDLAIVLAWPEVEQGPGGFVRMTGSRTGNELGREGHLPGFLPRARMLSRGLQSDKPAGQDQRQDHGDDGSQQADPANQRGPPGPQQGNHDGPQQGQAHQPQQDVMVKGHVRKLQIMDLGPGPPRHEWRVYTPAESPVNRAGGAGPGFSPIHGAFCSRAAPPFMAGRSGPRQSSEVVLRRRHPTGHREDAGPPVKSS